MASERKKLNFRFFLYVIRTIGRDKKLVRQLLFERAELFFLLYVIQFHFAIPSC